MRLTDMRLNDLINQVEYARWCESEHVAWLLSFLCRLVRLAPNARKNTPRGKRAAASIAWYAGSLVDDPSYTRNAEREAQEHKQQLFESALAMNRRWGIPIRDSVRWNAVTAEAQIQGAFDDQSLTNEIVRQWLVSFGVLEPVREAMLEMHKSFDADADPLFTEDAWPRWWVWAQREFFAEPRPAATVS